MQIEWLIFFYIAVSLAMTLFDLGFAAFEHTRDNGFKRRTQRTALLLLEEITLNAEFPTPRHKHTLERKMRALAGLESFDLCMESLRSMDEEKAERYLLGISDVFERLVEHYQARKPVNQAYFSYILRRWYRLRPASPKVVGMLVRFLEGSVVYVRQNAFEAIARLDDAALLVRAVRLIDGNASFHHPKLITETLLAFEGDRDALADDLSALLDELSPETQGAVINFLRMRRRGERAWLLAKMTDGRANQEVRIACVRYFMTNPWEEARRPLLGLVSSQDGGEWEFASVAASALAAYPGADTVEALKGALGSPVWHVRFNAAKSLYDLGVDPVVDLVDVLAGPDRFAREMVAYRWSLEGHELALGAAPGNPPGPGLLPSEPPATCVLGTVGAS